MDSQIRPSKVLVVDDAPANIRILSHSLSDEFEIAFATSGSEALEAVEEALPDLILLDVAMPDLDGYKVCRRLKSDPRTQQIPVIFVTGKESEADEIQGLELGAVDYITKPFSPAIVKARVRTHIELKRCRDQLESLALLDSLTGIPNRRRFEEFLDFSWSQCERSGAPLSAIIADVDHFKAYNDCYGHQAGDHCLRLVAQALQQTKQRATDLVARYGGEEFIALLPATDAEGALIFAESMRQAVADLRLPHARSSASAIVTVSLGVATMVPEPASAAASLLRRADLGLYRAKGSGRNQVERVADLAEANLPA